MNIAILTNVMLPTVFNSVFGGRPLHAPGGFLPKESSRLFEGDTPLIGKIGLHTHTRQTLQIFPSIHLPFGRSTRTTRALRELARALPDEPTITTRNMLPFTTDFNNIMPQAVGARNANQQQQIQTTDKQLQATNPKL